MKRVLLLFTTVLSYVFVDAQSVGIGTLSPNSSAQLDVTSTSKGLLVPRVNLTSLADAVTIANPATSLLVFNTNITLAGGTGYFYNSGTPGAPVWTKMLTNAAAGWSLSGNAGIDNATNFVGTTDAKRLHFRVSNQPSGWIDYSTGTTFFGYNAGKSFPFGTNSGSTGFGSNVMINYIGARNVAVGSSALYNNGQFGYLNTAIGFEAMYNNGNGAANVAVGNTSMHSNTLGDHNVAMGDSSMFSNADGANNTAIGANALKMNVTGDNNVAVGNHAMENAIGSLNTAIGVSSMRENISGSANTAVGYSSLRDNLTGVRNAAIGYNAMDENTDGQYNVAMGYAVMGSNKTGNNNTALGYIALTSNISGDDNVAIGANALAANTGNSNIGVGVEALRYNKNSVYNIAIGKSALATQSYTNDGIGYAANNIAIRVEALFNNQPNSSTNYQATNGVRNIAIGSFALKENTTGLNNTAIGHESLNNNTTGYWNIGIGVQSLLLNTIGNSNVAIGINSLTHNLDGDNNISMGIASLNGNTSGNDNTGLGNAALNANTIGSGNTAVGSGSGSFNNANDYCTLVGYNADQATSSNFIASTAIGYNARITASSQVRIGHSTVGSIGGYQPWSNLSDGRFKKNISEQVKGLDFIMALRPVTYNIDVNQLAAYMKEDEGKDASGKIVAKQADAGTRKERDEQSQIVHTGFVAQEVEAAAKKINYDFSGIDKPKNTTDLYGLRYSEFVVPLVKGMQEQQNEIALLKQRIQQLEELVKTLLPGK